MKLVKFFDTTLRDGEQSPDNCMSVKQKLKIALALEKLGVDTIEAGFPAASKTDYKATLIIAKKIKNASICVLARTKKNDIDVAVDSIKNTLYPRIHIFIATSPIHIKYKLRSTKSQILKEIESSIKYAKNSVEDIIFSPEDSVRSDFDFLLTAIDTAIESGATTINIPDTVGYATPEQYGNLIKNIKQRHYPIKISTHCHDDLGLANANTLAGIKNGAEEIQVTMNGIGERAGNAALEEVALALYTRKDYFKKTFRIKLEKIYETSQLVYKILGRTPPHEKPIVGTNAFRHEAGIHQDGLQKHPETYEIIKPENVGRKREFVYGKHSGRMVCRRLGIEK